MENVIMPKEISITPEIGQAFKNFRIEHKVAAKDIITKFKKATTYLTKFEKGDIKKIETGMFVEMCDFIANTENTKGVMKFVSRASENYEEYTPLTQKVLMNIDDLLCLHSVEPDFIDHIKDCIVKNNISESDLVDSINKNEDIHNYEGYHDFIENEWIIIDNDINKAFIKLNISIEFMHNLLNGDVKYINCVIAEGILYHLYLMIDIDDKARLHALDNLKRFNINRYRNCRIISIDTKTNDYQELDKYFGGLEPQVSTSLRNITTHFRVIATISKEVGSKRISTIEKNCDEDLGFYFAYISHDLSDIIKKSNQTKKDFLVDLKQLIAKYSEPEKESLDLYLD